MLQPLGMETLHSLFLEEEANLAKPTEQLKGSILKKDNTHHHLLASSF